MQNKSINFLLQICENFLEKESLENVATITDFSLTEIQKDQNDIYLGSSCEEYLKDLVMKGHAYIVTSVRHNCLQVYQTAANEIQKKLPINDLFFTIIKFLNHVMLFAMKIEKHHCNI